MDRPRQKRFAEVLTRRPAYAKLAAASVFLLVAGAGLSQRSAPQPTTTPSNPLGLLLSLGPGLAFLVQFFQSLRRKIARNVVIEPDAVLADGYPMFRRPEVTTVSRKVATIDVRRGVHRAPCELTFASETEAMAFESLLKTPPRPPTEMAELVQAWSPGRWRTLTMSVPIAGLLLTLGAMVWLGTALGARYAFLPPAAFVVLYLRSTSLPRIAVGTDGVRVSTRFGARFYDHGRIGAVAGFRHPYLFHKAALHLTVDGDRTVKVGFGLDALAEQRAGALLGKLRQRHTAYRAFAEPKPLPRLQGTTVDWLKQLRGVADGKDAAHRAIAVQPDAVRDALRNPRNDRETRAAAAFAVAATAEGRREVSAIASRTVNPELRHAFERCADADAAEIARVIDHLASTPNT